VTFKGDFMHWKPLEGYYIEKVYITDESMWLNWKSFMLYLKRRIVQGHY